MPLQSALSTASATTRPTTDKIVVAIHGVGRVLHSDAIRAAVRRVGARGEPPD
ncbi:hypothetical protein [Burkholderia sp. S171]|uniref:hypothetical protein n=1 Tax=Burkholderia sp. S171 TaxID=1641860 RepID=UPI00131C1D84|nr:hypothetical protein [Burkholderia sp. S171]